MSIGRYVKESDLNTSLKDENLSKSNALFLENEPQSGVEIAKRVGRRSLLLESIFKDQTQNSTPGSCRTTHFSFTPNQHNSLSKTIYLLI